MRLEEELRLLKKLPKKNITTVARNIYKESYKTCKMQHDWTEREDLLNIQYNWIKHNNWNTISVEAKRTPQSYAINNNALTVTNVNDILNYLVNISPSLAGNYIDLSGQTPSAAPTGQSITDKNTLITNGNTVTTD